MTMRFRWLVAIAAILPALSVSPTAHADDVVARFETSARVQFRLVIGATAVMNGRSIRLTVPNNDEKQSKFDPKTDLLATIKGLKTGDVIKATYAMQNNLAMLSAVAVYPLKPGEDLPNAFVFNESYDKKEGKFDYQMVDAKKFDQIITFMIPNKKDPKSGDMSPDPELLADAAKFKAGDVVLIDALNTRPHPQIKSIELYTPPQPGFLTKISEAKGEAGPDSSSVEIEADGKTITALVPGHQDGKKWVPDAKVLGEVKRLHVKSDVLFRTEDENGKTLLRGIAMAPHQTRHTAGAESKPAAEKPEKPDKPAAPTNKPVAGK